MELVQGERNADGVYVYYLKYSTLRDLKLKKEPLVDSLIFDELNMQLDRTVAPPVFEIDPISLVLRKKDFREWFAVYYFKRAI